MEMLLAYFIFSVGFNLALFLVAYILQTDKITDISYSLTFIAIAIFAFLETSRSPIDIMLLGFVLLWAVRLGGYLALRIHRIGRDRRFDDIRINFKSFFLFWLMQGITCFVVMIPILLAYTFEIKVLNTTVLIGFAIAVIGLLIETIADFQKYSFKKSNPQMFMNKGLWSFVQHPNYLGELLFWWGLYIACILFSSWHLSITGPLWITFILTGFSGIPILQKKWKNRYGENADFVKYQRSTYKLLPFIY